MNRFLPSMLDLIFIVVVVVAGGSVKFNSIFSIILLHRVVGMGGVLYVGVERRTQYKQSSNADHDDHADSKCD